MLYKKCSQKNENDCAVTCPEEALSMIRFEREEIPGASS